MIEQIKSLLNYFNKYGLPIPLLRDPKSGLGSVSLTMLFISFNVFLLGLIGKVAGKLGGIDLTQALYWNVLNASLYFGRTLSLNPKTGDTQIGNKDTDV
jgi:hypothetical protein